MKPISDIISLKIGGGANSVLPFNAGSQFY